MSPLLGYAKDGGLFVCDHIPTVGKNELYSWKDLKYPAVVGKLLRLYTTHDELTDTEIEGVLCTLFVIKFLIHRLYVYNP